MGFIDSYKHLEKLCGDMLQTQHGISAYIDDMGNTPKGSYLVQGWDEDFKRLKEENMCEYGDAQWIDDFYDRIMNQSDPLAMYRKATKPQPVAKPKQHGQSSQLQYTYLVQPVSSKKKGRKAAGWIVLLIIAALVGLFFVLKYLVN